ncbi:hypothetical protein MAPG_03998 [Magnaporthiopsis poae ATCC 64411]|uniref:Uncharacterized protein n=1 Tax=Magnaporthiopsis poae (strain ATCC 64411 / 73-15) TaxID=644358 RepID=A0A0C4DVJ2_MAGP6|nr:hypothetical protein MAPG_03998 [Magnaporthiopsis poae ATCC 64411]
MYDKRRTGWMQIKCLSSNTPLISRILDTEVPACVPWVEEQFSIPFSVSPL